VFLVLRKLTWSDIPQICGVLHKVGNLSRRSPGCLIRFHRRKDDVESPVCHVRGLISVMAHACGLFEGTSCNSLPVKMLHRQGSYCY
jgi:hypothetical protein